MPATAYQTRRVDRRTRAGTRELLQLLGEKWTLSLLDTLEHGPKRYSELRRRLRLTAKGLSHTLRSLESAGLVSHVEFPALRRQVHYELTPRGRALRQFVTTFAQHVDQRVPSGARLRQRFRSRAAADRDRASTKPYSSTRPRTTDDLLL